MAERPKRRKHRDNPYTLMDYDINGKYKVSFVDGKGKKQIVEISSKVYEAFNTFELEDLSELNEYDNHIEHSEIFENNLNERAKDKPISIEDEIIRKSTFEELKNALEKLPDIQKRRIKKYYFDDKTLNEIAEEEGCTFRAVKFSIDIGIKKLQEILKN